MVNIDKNNYRGSMDPKTVVIGAVVAVGMGYAALFGAKIYLGVIGAKSAQKYISQPVIETRDVKGESKPDLFIDRDGKRFYAEIDGKSIDDLFNNLEKKK